jgi:chromosomal replication initiation ATPase DnaA
MEQLILPEYQYPKYQKDDYIISTSNHLAYEITMKFSKVDNSNNQPLLICGPKHSGKSFLLNLWAQKTNALIIHNIDTFDFDNKVRGPLAIDNIDQIKSEDSLFHLFNWCQQEHIALLMTATNYNNFQLKDLASRIKSTPLVNLMKPDDAMVQIFIAKHFSDIGLKIPNKILSFLRNHLVRDFVVIKNFITIINKQSLNFNKKISIELVKKIIFSLQEK